MGIKIRAVYGRDNYLASLDDRIVNPIQPYSLDSDMSESTLIAEPESELTYGDDKDY